MCRITSDRGRLYGICENTAKLRDRGLRYRSLYNEVSDGIILSDVHGDHLKPNLSTIEMCGYLVDKFAQLKVVVVEEDIRAEPLSLSRFGRENLLKTRRLKCADGTISHAVITSTLLPTQQLVAVVRDIPCVTNPNWRCGK
ncbi:MAG: hypothetical protein M2R45_03154 [Verrucomicrobia subdivision 3 bacterium]|nr:hypothetical protein [Limisphaerales bacterium]MCS1413222.1 hypothetical protein [Limisphaerales bacterium]